MWKSITYIVVMKIAIFVESGVMTGVVTDTPGVEVILIDFDTDGEGGQLYNGEDCWASTMEAEVDPGALKMAEDTLDACDVEKKGVY